MEIGEKLRRLRVKKNFTQDYIAFCIGITQPAYHKIENGKTKVFKGDITILGKK